MKEGQARRVCSLSSSRLADPRPAAGQEPASGLMLGPGSPQGRRHREALGLVQGCVTSQQRRPDPASAPNPPTPFRPRHTAQFTFAWMASLRSVSLRGRTRRYRTRLQNQNQKASHPAGEAFGIGFWMPSLAVIQLQPGMMLDSRSSPGGACLWEVVVPPPTIMDAETPVDTACTRPSPLGPGNASGAN